MIYARPLDNKCMAVVILLDLSAAFDVIDHHILYERLEYSYGIRDDALSGFSLTSLVDPNVLPSDRVHRLPNT